VPNTNWDAMLSVSIEFTFPNTATPYIRLSSIVMKIKASHRENNFFNILAYQS
jgi:hypothetical protein